MTSEKVYTEGKIESSQIETISLTSYEATASESKTWETAKLDGIWENNQFRVKKISFKDNVRKSSLGPIALKLGLNEIISKLSGQDGADNINLDIEIDLGDDAKKWPVLDLNAKMVKMNKNELGFSLERLPQISHTLKISRSELKKETGSWIKTLIIRATLEKIPEKRNPEEPQVNKIEKERDITRLKALEASNSELEKENEHLKAKLNAEEETRKKLRRKIEIQLQNALKDKGLLGGRLETAVRKILDDLSLEE